MRDEATALKAKQTADGLRAMADVIEKYGGDAWPLDLLYLDKDLDVSVGQYGPDPDNNNEYGYMYDHDATMKAVRKAVRGLGPGKKEKTYSDSTFMVKKTFAPGVSLRVKANRKAVCKAVPTGRTIVHAASTMHFPERIEHEVEWVCEDALVASAKPV